MSTNVHHLKQPFNLRTSGRKLKGNSLCRQRYTQLFCLLLFLTSFQLQAQVVEWSTIPPSPSLSSPIIGIGCEDVTLDLIFSISVHPDLAPVEEAKPKQIRLELPEGITAVSAIKGTSTGSIGDFTPGAIEQNGTEVSIPIAVIPCNIQVHLAITLRAGDCETPTGERVVNFSILSNGYSLPGGSQTMPLEVVQPDITAIPVTAVSASVAYNTEVPFEIPLSVTNGVSIASLKITIQKENFVTLSDFRLDNKIITPEIDSSTVTLHLTPDLIGIPISENAKQTLKFNAQSSVAKNTVISASCDFPLISACFSIESFFEVMLTLTNSGEPGIVSFQTPNVTPVVFTTNPRTGEVMPRAYDALHVNYYRPRYMYNGPSSPTVTRLRVYLFESPADAAYKHDSYIDETRPIYYSITPTSVVTESDLKEVDMEANNCIYSDTLSKTGHMRLLKDEFLDKCSRVTFDILEPIPPGHYVYIYVPHVIGETFDNSSWKEIPVIYNERSFNITGNKILRIEPDFSWNVNGDKIPQISFYDMGRYNHPIFTTSGLSDFVTSASQQITATVPFKNNAQPAGLAYYFYVQLPEWLELMGTPTLDGIAFSYAAATPELLTGGDYFDAKKNTYRVRLVSNTTNGNITFTYRAKANGTGLNEYNYGKSLLTEDIRYWIDWDTGFGIEDDLLTPDVNEKLLRPVIHYITKTTHKITCTLGSDEINLDEFKLQRITRGLAVKGISTTESRVPASAGSDGSAPLANLDIINSETYLPGDTGRVEITTTILKSGFKYLYVLLNSDYLPYFNFTDFPLSESQIKISGTDYQADQISQNGNKLYIRFPAPTSDFAINTPFDIVIPFKAGYDSVLITLKDLQASVSVTTEIGDANTDHFNPPSQDLKVQNWRIHYPFGFIEAYGQSVAYTFSNTVANQSIELGYIHNITNLGNMQGKSYAYPNEYRPYWHPHQVTMTVPSGLAISGIMLRPFGYNDVTTDTNTGVASQTINKYTDSIPNNDGTVSYVYDISSIFDFEADSYEKVQRAIADGKWIAPDDATGYYIYGYFTPLPSLVANGAVWASLSFYTRPSFEAASDTTIRKGRGFLNSTPFGVLNIPVDSIPTYDKSVTVPSITATINGGDRDAWLYVDGDISGMELYNKTTSSNLTVTEDGWIPLGKLGATQDIELKYTLNSSTDTQVDIYLIADFPDDLSSTTPTGNITDFMANDGRRYLGGKRTVKNPVNINSALQGSITVPASIEHDTDYPVIFSMHSKTGEANVINPIATVTVPVGQLLQKAEYEYPVGNDSWTNIPSEAITDDGSQLIIETSKFSDAPFTLYGNRVSGKTDNDRILNIRLTFKPDCHTELNGFFYWVSYAGTNLVGNSAKGANIRANVPVYAKVNRNYAFSTSISLPGYAFGGNIRNRVLQADVN
ncbi:MAG: hypothetical protein LBM08_09000, partial [Dysgonamonadaceae bacterium]|nr:hypothetical protein [Dysgonamonadaceae bacterium]